MTELLKLTEGMSVARAVIDFRPPPDQLTTEMKSIGFERAAFIERWQGQDGVYAALFVATPAGASAPDPR